MDKKFIFMTGDIHFVGGMQNYVRSKIRYLLKDEWKVYVLYGTVAERITGECAFQELNPYVDGAVCLLRYPEVIFADTLYFKITLFEMLRAIEYDSNEECEYLIESHADCEAVWGEILAQEIKAKHICFTCNERFRGSDKRYVNYIDFFDFKYSRGELAGISEISMQMLFDGYKDIDASEKYVLVPAIENPVQDVSSERVDKLEKQDWNIAYIGRCEKDYFPFIIDDIFYFARKYSEMKIQFIIVGNLYERDKKLLEKLNSVQNIQVTYLGCFSPIPKNLFKKMDVSIAGAGCAVISFLEGVPTILADAKTYKAAGILGCSVLNSLYGKREYSYTELLESVLVEKKNWQLEKIKYDFYEAKKAYDNFFSFVERSNKEREYYKFEHQNMKKGNMDSYLMTRLILSLLKRIKDEQKLRLFFIESIFLKYGKDIGLFGYGMIGQKLEVAMPELIFKKVYDNNNISTKTERPTEDNINEVSVMLIAPIKIRNEIAEELVQRKYKGKTVFIDELFPEIYYNALKTSLERDQSYD